MELAGVVADTGAALASVRGVADGAGDAAPCGGCGDCLEKRDE